MRSTRTRRGTTERLRPLRVLSIVVLILAALLAAPPATQATSAEPPDCFGRTPTIVGTDGPDNLKGTTGNDVIYGGDGNDKLDGELGTDRICGGSGNDTFQPQEVSSFGARERFDGGSGTDLITYASSENFNPVIAVLGGNNDVGFTYLGSFATIKNMEDLTGTSFDDRVTGGPGTNTISLGAGNDIYTWQPADAGGQDTVFGGADLDTAVFARSPVGVTVDLNAGSFSVPGYSNGAISAFENVVGSFFADDISGSDADNDLRTSPDPQSEEGGSLRGLGGADFLLGSDGNDTYEGGDGNDRLHDQDFGNDSFDGGPGDDEIAAFRGGSGENFVYPDQDEISGGDGKDSLAGSKGADVVTGGAGIDDLFGRSGNDSLSGEGDADRLFGDEGNDTLSGGDGIDQFNGGQGLDSCSDADSGTEFATGCNGPSLTDSDLGEPLPAAAVVDVDLSVTRRVDRDQNEQIYTVKATNDGPDVPITIIAVLLPGTEITSSTRTDAPGGCSHFIQTVEFLQRQAYCSPLNFPAVGNSATWEVHTKLKEPGGWAGVVAHAFQLGPQRDPNPSNNTVVLGADIGEEPTDCTAERLGRLQTPACAVTLTGPEFVERGEEFTLTAALTPCPGSSNKEVGLLREVEATFGVLQKARTNAECKAKFKVRIRKDTRFKARSPANAATNESPVITVQVRPVPPARPLMH